MENTDKLGVIVPETVQIFHDILNEAVDSPQNIKEKYSNTLVEYFKAVSQNDEKLKQLCVSLTGFCLNGLSTSKEKFLRRLIKIKRIFYLKTSLSLRMRKWRLVAFKLAISSYRNYDGWSNKTTIITSKTKKEDEELKECTFHPTINISTSTRNSRFKTNNSVLIDRSSNNSTVYTRLYNDYIRMNLKKDIKRNETEIQLGENTSFFPRTLSTPKKFQSLSSRSFNERLRSYHENKDNHKDKLAKCLEDVYKTQYTFIPTTNKRPIFSLVKSRHLDGHSKKKSENELYPNEQKGKTSRPLDLKRIENLYLSYKQKKNKIRNMQTGIDKECGYTYQPILTSNDQDKYRQKIENDLLERNEQFINNKKESLAKASKYSYSYQQPKYTYTLEEKKQITQNIIERLYHTGVQKTLSKNGINSKVSSEENKYLPTVTSQLQEKIGNSDDYNDKIISLDDYQNKKIIIDKIEKD